MSFYQGPPHEQGNRNHVSVAWLEGKVTGGRREVEYPAPTPYSVQVAQRIINGTIPKQTIMGVLGWPKRKSRSGDR